MEHKKKIILSIIALTSIVLITVGVSVAFFNYAKEGTTENSITTDSITFLYTENSKGGKGIKLEDSFPMSDELGKKQQEEGSYFDFKITSKTAMNNAIPYEVTVRKSSESTLKDDNIVKIYLTDNTNGKEEEIFLKKFSELEQTKLSNGKDHTEKTIYTGKVPSNSSNYEKSFRLRMWIDENADFSEKEDGTSNSGKTFQITVNVYANGKVVDEEEKELESNSEIKEIIINDKKAVKVENKKWDYEIGLESTANNVFEIVTVSKDTKVKIEKIDNLEEMNSKEKDYQVVPLANSNSLELEEGDNYYKITTIPLKGEEKVSKINIHVGKYSESILNGTDPIIKEKLIPIIINEDGTVVKVDENYKWYSYAEKEWANAVILNTTDDYEVGEIIPEEAIESYFVWIPKYRYKIFSDTKYSGVSDEIEDKVQTIEVVFENKDTPVSEGKTKDTWLTHPAFTSFNTNGIWVGKFETGYKDADSTDAALVNPDNEQDAIEKASQVIIKPNVYSWRGIQIAKAYVVGRNYEANLNSHMMKNTEWGAVAYLQQSIYGSRQEVRINNNSSYLTGYAAIHEPTAGLGDGSKSCSLNPNDCNEYGKTEKGIDSEISTNYFNKVSVVASTTNNYTGIFDMSGGAWDRMMAGMEDSPGSNVLASGSDSTNNSGFNGKNLDNSEVKDGIALPNDSRYYDIYLYNANTQFYKNFIFGDATGEMGPFKKTPKNLAMGSWYGDRAQFVNYLVPWFNRGGAVYTGTEAGVFEFDRGHGSASSNVTFRLVLAPNN